MQISFEVFFCSLMTDEVSGPKTTNATTKKAVTFIVTFATNRVYKIPTMYRRKKKQSIIIVSSLRGLLLLPSLSAKNFSNAIAQCNLAKCFMISLEKRRSEHQRLQSRLLFALFWTIFGNHVMQRASNNKNCFDDHGNPKTCILAFFRLAVIWLQISCGHKRQGKQTFLIIDYKTTQKAAFMINRERKLNTCWLGLLTRGL